VATERDRLMAQKRNLTIDQRATFSHVFDVIRDGEAASLSGYEGAAAMKTSYYAESNAAVFDVTVGNTNVTVSMNAETTAAIEPGRYVYDVRVYAPSGASTRVVEGLVTVKGGVS